MKIELREDRLTREIGALVYLWGTVLVLGVCLMYDIWWA